MSAHTTACLPCSGSGLVPRPKRRLPNGELDPFDTVDWPKIACEKCGGSGAQPLDPGTIKERAPGVAALRLVALVVLAIAGAMPLAGCEWMAETYLVGQAWGTMLEGGRGVRCGTLPNLTSQDGCDRMRANGWLHAHGYE